MKNIKVEWCENFIRAWFAKHAFLGPNAGIEVNCFWKLAETSGLWERGTYDKVMGKGYDGAYYSEADECIEEDY